MEIKEKLDKVKEKSVLQKYLKDILIPKYGSANIEKMSKPCKMGTTLNWFQEIGIVSAYYLDDKMIVTYLDCNKNASSNSYDALSKLKADLYIVNGEEVKKISNTGLQVFDFDSGGNSDIFTYEYNDKNYLCIENNSFGLMATGCWIKIGIYEINDSGFKSVGSFSGAGSSGLNIKYNDKEDLGPLSGYHSEPQRETTEEDKKTTKAKIDEKLLMFGLSLNKNIDISKSNEKDFHYSFDSLVINKENCNMITNIFLPYPNKDLDTLSLNISDYTNLKESIN